MKKQKINLDKKIAVIEDFIKRRTVGKVQNICMNHIDNVKRHKNEIDIKELKQLFKDYLETIESNNAIRDTEMSIYNEA